MNEPVVTTHVLYSCSCGLARVRCEVPARGDEDVVAWVQATVAIVSRDHLSRSPSCREKELAELLIPIKDPEKIGGPAIN